MIFHISEDRFERIKRQGYPLGNFTVYGNGKDGPKEWRLKGENTYHFLSSDRALCNECGLEFEGIQAETPAGLELAKINLQSRNEN